MTKEKEKPIGVCDFCGGPIHPDEWYTSKGNPRLHCSIDCRQTENSRRGAPIRSEKAKERVERGQWENPAKLNPPTPEEQGRRAKLGREREVEAGTWRNPALDDAAREKLSRPRVHNDPVLHAAIEKLRHSPMSELTPEEREAYRLYRLGLKPKPDRKTANAYSRRRYHARQAAMTPEKRQVQREKYKQNNHIKEARRAGKPLASVTYPGRVQLWTPTPEGVTAVDLGYVLRLKRESWTIGLSAAGPWSEETFSTRSKAVGRLRELYKTG